ncbi:DSK1 [Symbiodinium sp. CCMP2592]|nr:DSK1 [Symbiodinium sp. CCMP2592]
MLGLGLQAGARVRSPTLTLADFQKESETCYERGPEPEHSWAVVDSHLHARPFGGPPVPFADLLGRLRRAGILFTTLYGIGQRLPIDSACTYYLDCPGVNITPSLKNDFFNAQSVLDNAKILSDSPVGPVITLSMSFFDLHNVDEILYKMNLLQGEFPSMFKWVGEINLVKQALWPNEQGLPVPLESIKTWGPFMAELRKQDIPLSLHADLGDDTEGQKFLPLMDEVLRLYPKNKIIWMHLAGLSRQLDPKLSASLLQRPTSIEDHVELIESRLKKFPKLMIDLSWDVLYDEIYNSAAEEKPYIKLINNFPTRFLSGSDHVAAAVKTEEVYRQELNKTSEIYRHLSDDAFRRIALGQNLFDVAGLEYTAPKICESKAKAGENHPLPSFQLHVPGRAALPSKHPGAKQQARDLHMAGVDKAKGKEAEQSDHVKQVQRAETARLLQTSPSVSLKDFTEHSTTCYDRVATDEWPVVDAHLHARPFGGPPVPFDQLIERLRRAGILFANLYGIGQRLPISSNCTYYLDCPGTPIRPSLKNDFFNAQSILDNYDTLSSNPLGPVLTPSISFFDLHADAADNLKKLKLLQQEFPGMFRWAGEINVVKQALWKNDQGLPVDVSSIKSWKPLMDELQRQDIPMALHSDLGNQSSGLMFLNLMDEILKLYPKNKIVWVHMAGLSKQLDPKLALIQLPLLAPLTIQHHVQLIEDRLDKHPNLFIDLSWDVLYDEIYDNASEERRYVDLLNAYPTRFLSGTDHVAAASKPEAAYRDELAKTSVIYRELTDEAFRNIALGGTYFRLAHLPYRPPPICGLAASAVPGLLVAMALLQAGSMRRPRKEKASFKLGNFCGQRTPLLMHGLGTGLCNVAVPPEA